MPAPDSMPVSTAVKVSAPTTEARGAGGLAGVRVRCGRRDLPSAAGRDEDAAQDGQHQRHHAIGLAPAPPGAQQRRDQQRTEGGAEPVAGVHPVDVAGAEVPGGVRVESGVERPETDPEQHSADDHHPHRRREGLGGQGQRDQQGGPGHQRARGHAEAAGDGAGDDRGGDAGHEQDPQRPDRLAEAEPHRGPQQAQGGTGQGDAQVRQAGE
jgi:hypothetical protein